MANSAQADETAATLPDAAERLVKDASPGPLEIAMPDDKLTGIRLAPGVVTPP